MTMKFIGVIMVIVSCGGVGLKIAANHRQEEHALRQLIKILDYMECELQYRLTPLPALCRQAYDMFPGLPGKVFMELSLEINAQISPDIAQCMNAALNNVRSIPAVTRMELELLGKSIGRFDLDGQLKGLDAVREDCKRNLNLLTDNQENRLRSYQTLGLCAGAALAILFV